MYRDISGFHLSQSYYLIGVIMFLFTTYISMVRLFVFNPEAYGNDLAVKILFLPLQVSYVMLVWSMVRVIISDPGKVPIYYGVLMDDSENKKRRYCLICHIFKPDRCHHCSTCKRCVLNMDHHCPWISNCVGYQNRKFFLLFLFYINITILQSIVIILLRLIPLMSVFHFEGFLQNIQINILLQFITLVIVLTFGVMIMNFFYFHICLVSENRTTIDTLEIKRSNIDPSLHQNFYDLGGYRNWLQVMGNNKWLWLLPIFGESGRPVGDGVHWERKEQSITENNQTNRTFTNNRRQ